jgi:FAD/FMN-containing dehydrogenase
VIIRFHSRFGTLEESSAIDRPGGVIVRTTEEVNDRCRAANDRTRTVIVRSYRTGPVELNVKLEKKNQIYEN